MGERDPRMKNRVGLRMNHTVVQPGQQITHTQIHPGGQIHASSHYLFLSVSFLNNNAVAMLSKITFCIIFNCLEVSPAGYFITGLMHRKK